MKKSVDVLSQISEINWNNTSQKNGSVEITVKGVLLRAEEARKIAKKQLDSLSLPEHPRHPIYTYKHSQVGDFIRKSSKTGFKVAFSFTIRIWQEKA